MTTICRRAVLGALRPWPCRLRYMRLRPKTSPSTLPKETSLSPDTRPPARGNAPPRSSSMAVAGSNSSPAPMNAMRSRLLRRASMPTSSGILRRRIGRRSTVKPIRPKAGPETPTADRAAGRKYFPGKIHNRSYTYLARTRKGSSRPTTLRLFPFRNSDRLLRDRDRRFESLSLRKRVCCQRTADRVR